VKQNGRDTESLGAAVTHDAIGGRSARYPTSQIVQALSIAALSAGLIWLVWIYGSALRDPRYFDGWVLAVGMAVQFYFHIAIKTARLSPKSALRWRKTHIFLGYVLVAAFLSHSDFSLPDTAFEWALWTSFVLVTVSGLFGTYLAWSLKTKRLIDEGVTFDRIPALRAELARAVQTAVAGAERAAAQSVLPGLPPLPGLPHDAWISDLYSNYLRDFFAGPRNFTAHLIGSQRPLKRLTDEIDSLSRYVTQENQEKLAAIRNVTVEKDRLDFARVYLTLTRAWLFVHVPVTYALIVLSITHGLVVYAFSSGSW
jgi:hypothetical protein